MESLADNRLYAWDHSIDYVSTFKKKGEKKERKKRKEKEKIYRRGQTAS
jgi:hypothetical protein